MKPRWYQTKAIELTRKAYIDGHRKIMLFLATGAGKGLILEMLIKSMLKKNQRVCLCIRRRQLILQTARRFEKAGFDPSVIMGNEKGFDPEKKFQICSIDTIHRRDFSFMIGLDCLLVDECHDCTAPKYEKFLSEINAKLYIGMTATPFPIGKNSHVFWDCCVKPVEMDKLRDQGYLTDAVVFQPGQLDLAGIKTDSKTGDYNQKQLGLKMSEMEIVGDIVKDYIEFGKNLPALCFAVNKEHSISLTEEFNHNGIPAIHCDDSTKQADRDAAIEGLRTGKYKVVSSIGIFLTGTDVPWAQVLVDGRPTKSETLHIQKYGRILRPMRICGKCNQIYDNSDNCYHCGYDSPSFIKEKAIIIDNANNSQRHGPLFKTRYAVLTQDDKASIKEIQKDDFKTKVCEFCFATYTANSPECPHCFKKNTKIQRSIRTTKGKLVPIDEYLLMRDRLIHLMKIQMEKGLKESFPYYALCNEFGDLVYRYKELKVPKWIGSAVKNQKLKDSKTYQ